MTDEKYFKIMNINNEDKAILTENENANIF